MRKNRTAFRKTLGEDFAKAKMKITQDKLSQCMHKGPTMSTTSFQRLAAALNPGNSDVAAMDTETKTTELTGLKGNTVLVPVKKKHRYAHPEGQDGARLLRNKLSKMKSRGTWKNGQKIHKKKTVGILRKSKKK